MTIISRPTPVVGPGCAASLSPRSVTRPGSAPRVGAAAPAAHACPGHSIEGMDPQPALELVTTTPEPIGAEDRPWIYDQVLTLVAQGRVWTDNRRRRWLYDGTSPAPADRMPERQQQTLAELYRQGHVRIATNRIDMPAPDCRTLRARRYEPTTSGTELHHRWAGLTTYTA